MSRYIDAVHEAEVISEKLEMPLADLVDIFALIPSVREQGGSCDYCCTDIELRKTLDGEGYIFIDLDIDIGYATPHLITKGEDVQIRFCPMCGRRAGDEI